MTDNPMPTKKKLEGKVAIVTGETTARCFSDNGAAAVVIADIQDESGTLIAASIGSDRCTYIHCDAADEQQVKSMIDQTVQIYGRLDIMISNAGISSKGDQTIMELDLSAMDRLFEVNVRGMAACVKHAARVMAKTGVKGSIVCTASIAASTGSDKRVDYYMSKHAVLGLMRSASRQLGSYGIRVNSVSPAAVATPLLCSTLQMDTEQVEKAYEPLFSLKGVTLKVKHVADAMLFLASEHSAFITGHNLAIDGGYKLPAPILHGGELFK